MTICKYMVFFLLLTFGCIQPKTDKDKQIQQIEISNLTDTFHQTIQLQTTTKTSDSEQQIAEETFRQSDCTRGAPEPVVKKDVFPKTTFQLQADSLTAFETVEFDNEDKLIIEHSGCEYYVLIFRFETNRFHNDTTNSKYWFEKALQLIKETEKGLDTPVEIKDGINALAKYIDRTHEPKFGEELDYGQNEIRYFLAVDKVQKLTGKRFIVEMYFAVGPL